MDACNTWAELGEQYRKIESNVDKAILLLHDLVHALVLQLSCIINADRPAAQILDRADLAQEEMIAQQCFGKINWKGIGSFKAFVAGIARKILLKQRRGEGRNPAPSVVPPGFDAPSDGGDPAEIAKGNEQFERLLKAIAGLSEVERLMIKLYYFEQVPAEQAAQLLGISLSTFHRIRAAAIRKLQFRLTR